MYRLNSFFLFALVIFLSGCKSVFDIPSVEGWIIDAETKSPIQGAVVVIERPVNGGYHGGEIGTLKFQEAVTDKNGYYYIPELGAVKLDGYIDTSAPYMYVFKAGYQYASLRNIRNTDRSEEVSERRYQRNQPSVWNKEKIELSRFVGSDKEYEFELINISSSFNRENKFIQTECNWVGYDLPLFFRALNREESKYSDFIDSRIMDEYKGTKHCEEWKEFLKVYRE